MKYIIILVILGLLVSCSSGNIEIDIVSLKQNSEINGSFFLGCGSIDQEEYYYMYGKTDGGGYSRLIIPTRGTDIIETSTMKPKATFIYRNDTMDYNKDILFNYRFENKLLCSFGKINKWIIYVPLNTVIKKINELQ